jgi:integrase/recombinase XerD
MALQWIWKHEEEENTIPMELWKNPHFINMLKHKKTKLLSLYSETEIWDGDDFQTIIKYEHYKRNKGHYLYYGTWMQGLMKWLLQIKNIRLKETYGEGEIPHHIKTGGGPIFLTFSFPYVRDWLDEHTFKNETQKDLWSIY